MPSPKKGSLQEHNIYFQRHDNLVKCPAKLQDLFRLIIGVQYLKSDHFGGYVNDSNHELPELELELSCASQTYEKELKNESIKLSGACSDNQRPDDIEDKWVKILEPIVFYRFNREQEERYERERHQHW